MTVIDIHTHMIPRKWLDLLQSGSGDYELKATHAGHTAIHFAGAPFVTLMPEMFDYDLRLQAMDAAGVDMAILSLSGPNVFWGTAAVSAEAAIEAPTMSACCPWKSVSCGYAKNEAETGLNASAGISRRITHPRLRQQID